jgi:aconitate hydratase
MGVLPLQFAPGDSAKSLGLTGFETLSIDGFATGIKPNQSAHVYATHPDGSRIEFQTTVRIDAAAEVEYYLNGGILQMVLRQIR